MIELRGSTWDHSRGYDPLPATAAAFMAEHPDVKITWERRSLQEFGEMSVPDLAGLYDLVVLDHPWMGGAYAKNALLPLDKYLDAAYLEDQARNSVGLSYESYVYEGHLWALAVDAAAQASAYRPDLLERYDAAIPQSWDAVLALARRLKQTGKTSVSFPLVHVDSLPSFYSICANLGEVPFTKGEIAVSRAMGQHVLGMLRELYLLGLPDALGWNPPKTLDRMSTTDDIVYAPLLFCYSNYARPGFRPNLVRFTNIPRNADGLPTGTMLGGAGIAVSSVTKHPEIACAYAAMTSSGDVQRTLYFETGGQPGHRAAWTDEKVNAACNNFFLDVLDTLDGASLRPRYNGWIHVQETGGYIITHYLAEGGDVNATLDALDELYRASLR